jgi:hypothetical protein
MTRCRACLSHAEHKRFATREAAEANRAHPGCDCTLLITKVSADEYAHMFGGANGAVEREIFDLRRSTTAWPWRRAGDAGRSGKVRH